ncbi:MAG TPA: glutamate racemase [Steroidobacteraceae bacterium]|nr:glutamate racemase [Steroidobacteraceae bacterium]
MEAPIGVFDSGIGGLTVLAALVKALPHERFVYLGDTARLPYGTKSAQTVERYAVQAAQALMARDVKCLVVACNTAAAVGLEAVRARAGGLPVIGVIEPGAEAACAATRSGHIAVIATEATVRGGAYQRAILERRPDAQVVQLPTQLLVALAEEGLVEGPVAQGVISHYLGQLSAQDPPDTLVLGCTHFPALAPAIRQVVGPMVCIVDSAQTTAAAVRTQLMATGLARTTGTQSVQFIATDGPERFARVGSRFLGRDIEVRRIELIDL